MRTRTLRLLAAVAGILMPALAMAVPHGGQYRGPEDTVPPGSGRDRSGGTPTGPGGGPTGPTRPTPGSPQGPSGPTTGPGGGPVGPGGASGPRTGADLGPDLSLWQYWWEFNKDPFLQLRKHVRSQLVTTGEDDFALGRRGSQPETTSLAPSESDLTNVVIPALKAALQDPKSNRTIRASCMVALAKIGKDPSVLPLFRRLLPSNDQVERETAALAMGIAALPEAVGDLLALARDEKAGRKLVEKESVDFRTRSFACYGLGLIAYATTDVAIKERVLGAMCSLLDDPATDRHDVQVAGLNAIRLLRPDLSSDAGQALADRAVRYLLGYIDRRDVFAQVQSHAWTAIANLAGRRRTERDVHERLLATLDDRSAKMWMHQSAVLALGQMAVPEDAAVAKRLQGYARDGRDEQARAFSYIALGMIGGESGREFLRQRLVQSGTQKIHKPWIALGLAILHAGTGDPTPADATAADVLAQFEDIANPVPASGLGIALGIMRDKRSGPELHRRMLKVANDDEAAGYLAVALGLMGYHEAKEDIQAMLAKATRRDKLLTQCAIGLGLLGDKEAALDLASRLAKPNPVAVFSALAQGLGFIGDRRTIPTLVDLLGKQDLQPMNRAFAAVALGLICDKEDLPWNSKIAVNINYRANVETLTSGSVGILDIL